jgi:hypothetical protein
VDLSGSHRAQTGRNANFVETIGAKPLQESALLRGTSGTNTMSFQWRDSIRSSRTCFLALILSAGWIRDKAKTSVDPAAF